ncbi:MAG: hypothetical protein V1789_02315 [PVC group bacterium]
MKKSNKVIGLALIVCDEVIEDKKTSKKSLIGMFNRIVVKEFPCKHPRLHVFVSLTGGRGEHKVDLRCINQSTRKPLFGATGKIGFNNPNAIIEVDFDLQNAVFPEPGNYAFEFLCDDEWVLDRPFVVVKREEINE